MQPREQIFSSFSSKRYNNSLQIENHCSIFRRRFKIFNFSTTNWRLC